MDNSFNPPHLWQVDHLAVEFETLWVAYGLLAILALEVGVFSPTLEKVCVCPIKVFGLLLQDLGICLLEPSKVRVPFGRGQFL